MDQRFAEFPRYLAARARRVDLAGVPAMVALPDEEERAGRALPAVVWMHGRTASKEMDPGRYMRWVRAGMAAVALDLPGHGARFDAAQQEPGATLDVLERMLGELNGAVAALREVPGIDAGRLGIGGMSLGGMVALRRLCDAHGFGAASVEGTCGWLEGLYFPAEFGMPARAWPIDHPRERVRRLEGKSNLAGMSPVPMLILHSEADEMVAWEAQRRFVEDLRGHYASRGADPGLVRLKTWPRTGAPREHIGFGTVSHEAKTLQTEFFARVLGIVEG
jgi:dienelactone hydrolase